MTTTWPATILGRPLIGRGEEVRRVIDLLGRPGVRLVSVTGAGGVGKTSVAFEVVGELCRLDPAIVVGLGAATEPSQLLGLVAESLGLRADSSAAAFDRIAAVLAGRSDPVVVLDDVDHLLSAVPEALALLDRCPTLRILVTTRRALNVAGEHVIELHGLPTPNVGESEWTEIGRAEAVRLFVDRALAVQPSFALTAENAGHVAEVCRRVEGLPLAVELAAARCAMLPIADLAGPVGTASLLDATDPSRVTGRSGSSRCAPACHGVTTCSPTRSGRCCAGPACSSGRSRWTMSPSCDRNWRGVDGRHLRVAVRARRSPPC